MVSYIQFKYRFQRTDGGPCERIDASGGVYPLHLLIPVLETAVKILEYEVCHAQLFRPCVVLL